MRRSVRGRKLLPCEDMSRQLGVHTHRRKLSATAGLHAACRLFRTVWHLRAGQLFQLVLHRLRPACRASGAVASRGMMPTCGQLTVNVLDAPPGCSNSAGDVQKGVFTFFSRRETLGFPPDWRAAGTPRLWLYNLHYHEFLQGLTFEAAREVVLDWILHHRPGRGQVGWEPYPLSVRLSVWCAVFLAMHRARTLADARFRDLLWASLAEQADLLCARPERHLSGHGLRGELPSAG